MSLEEIVKRRIEEEGAINVAEFMSYALSHPEYGYYMKRDPLGKEGDFVTSPEISQVFGEMIGGWLAHSWLLLGSPEDVAMVEIGAGRGTLMADILRSTKHISGFHDAIDIHIVETSPTLRQKQWKTLAGKHERIEWHDDIDNLPDKPLLLVANEFFDALPVRQFNLSEKGIAEIFVDVVDGDFSFVTAEEGEVFLEIPDEILNIYENRKDILGGKKEITVEICEPAINIVEKMAERIGEYGGVCLIIDYGYIGGSRGDTLQAVRYHAYQKVLSNIGDNDITAHVDFQALSQAAGKYNVNIYGPVAQGAFLMRLGAGERTVMLCRNLDNEEQKVLMSGLERIADPKEMGELFKVLAITSKDIIKAEGF
ncbi:MAG: SAM-dependent methyltransferase [Rickettsiales bacterium]